MKQETLPNYYRKKALSPVYTCIGHNLVCSCHERGNPIGMVGEGGLYISAYDLRYGSIECLHIHATILSHL